MKKYLILAILLALGSYVFSYYESKPMHPLFGNYNPAGAGTYRLQSSLSSTGTSITLTSFTEPISGNKYTMSYLNSSIEYGTIEPQTSNREFISFSGITQNSDGSATLTGVSRGLSPAYPYTASSTFQLAHPAQSIFILSNPPQLTNQYLNLLNANTVSGINTFSSTSPPRYDFVAAQGTGTYIATTSEFASIAYVNGVALSGAPNASPTVKGIVQFATALQAASSTATGSTGALLVLGNGIATDTPSVPQSVSGSKVLMTTIGGFLNQAWLDLTANWNWTGTHTWTGANGKIGIGTTTPYAPLSVVGQSVFSYFTATSTTATSTLYNLGITNNATTTNLTVSGTCTNCATNGYEQITNTNSVNPFNTGSTLSATASCSAGKKVVGGGVNISNAGNGTQMVHDSYPSGTNSWIGTIAPTVNSSTNVTVTVYAICVNP